MPGPAQASKCWGQRRREGGSLLGHPPTQSSRPETSPAAGRTAPSCWSTPQTSTQGPPPLPRGHSAGLGRGAAASPTCRSDRPGSDPRLWTLWAPSPDQPKQLRPAPEEGQGHGWGEVTSSAQSGVRPGLESPLLRQDHHGQEMGMGGGSLAPMMSPELGQVVKYAKPRSSVRSAPNSSAEEPAASEMNGKVPPQTLPALLPRACCQVAPQNQDTPSGKEDVQVPGRDKAPPRLPSPLNPKAPWPWARGRGLPAGRGPPAPAKAPTATSVHTCAAWC